MTTSETSSKKRRRILLDCGNNEVEFLRFTLGSCAYGINVAKIQQVIVHESDAVTPVPHTLEFVTGQMLHRGECMPIVSLRHYLRVEAPPPSTAEIIVICDFNGTRIGFIVDRVTDILRCSWDSFHGSDSGSGVRSQAISGTVVWDGIMTPILDVEEILCSVKPEAAINRDLPALVEKATRTPRNKTIVYCEDSKTVQAALKQALGKLGYEDLKIFANGQDGLAFLRDNPTLTVDLIISDIEMPKMDGLTLCKEVRALKERARTPFIFFSSTITHEMKSKCASVGGNGAFSKPEIMTMAAEIDTLLAG